MVSLGYPPRVELATRPTPLQYLERASQRWGRGHRLWVKRDDLTGCLLSGNKVRKLEFIVAHALEQGCDTLITCGGLQSNHCRATAFAGAQMGLAVHLLLRGEQPAGSEGNYLLDQLAGATINCYPKRQYVAELPALFEHWQAHYRAAGRKALVIPTGGSDGLGIWGYIAACDELADDLAGADIASAQLVTATGSGGTQAGLTVGVALQQLPLTVWGINVCDDEQYFLDKVAADVADWQARYPDMPALDYEPRIIDGYVGSGYGIAAPEVFSLIAELAALEGLLLDPVYTGKAFFGMVREIAAGRFGDCRDIVFLHTGGAFGVFPQARGFDLPGKVQ
ncbi:D-cysteine desulfhydrase family protein [Kineobactrum sediminis]|uniref:D-cysteine desulfhydrase family protein n=1 Tax=Kineobactrum sediminis TaxID=1905677 RepID=A0A2N5Y2I8_9GAMM|nr:D-cysteine desulfhydrase family protein [Kineobactrum sediminis]PLW82605.1 D-cysteine desulfhydrase family protein [Kineobactrum sediminis]